MKHRTRETPINGAGTRERRVSGLLLCCVAFLLVGPTSGQEPSTAKQNQSAPGDRVAMTVDERQISVSELCSAVATLPPPQAKAFPLHPAFAAQWYGPLIALAEEAKREHLGQQFLQAEISPVDQANALSAELIRKIAHESEPTGAQIEQYYVEHRKEFERTKARHIVISYATALSSRSSRTLSEARAKAYAISAALKRGADFAELAARDSDDQYTKAKAGDLGDVSHNQMEPAIDQSIWSLAPGETSAPFEGRFGYEIVRIESRRILPLNESRETIIGNIKFLRTIHQRQEIISKTRITLKKIYIDSPLPCGVKTVALTN
jgi:hypothetical protein